jgi:hypothetical protein
MDEILVLHDPDRLVRLIFQGLASRMVINDNFEKTPIGLFPLLLASLIQLLDPMKENVRQDIFVFDSFTCPCPSDIVLRRLANFISSANLYKSAAGSVPTDNTKINGVVADESRKTRCKSAVYKIN